MIPRRIFELMAEERSRTAMDRDEHGRPIEEQEPTRKPDSKRAYMGYKDFPKDYSATNQPRSR